MTFLQIEWDPDPAADNLTSFVKISVGWNGGRGLFLTQRELAVSTMSHSSPPQCDYFTILGMGGIRPPDRLVITGVLWDSIPWTRHDFPDEIPIVRRLNPKLPVDGHWISHSNLHLWRISGWFSCFSCWFHADFMLILYWPLRQALLVGRGAWWGGAFDGHRSGDGSAARRGQREPVGPAGMVEMDGMDDNFHGIFWWFFGISQVDLNNFLLIIMQYFGESNNYAIFWGI